MTHPQFRIDTLRQDSRELAHQIDRTGLPIDGPTRQEIEDPVSFRLCRASDDPSLERIAALDMTWLRRAWHYVVDRPLV
jgi:hypothetical protein